MKAQAKPLYAQAQPNSASLARPSLSLSPSTPLSSCSAQLLSPLLQIQVKYEQLLSFAVPPRKGACTDLKMSLLFRLKQHLPCGVYRNSVAAINPGTLRALWRNYGQPARIEEEEEEEFDQRRLPTNYDPATFDPSEHRSPPSDRVFRLVDEISGLTLTEVSELGSILMRKRGMKELPSVAVMKPGAAGFAGAAKMATAAKEEKKPEKTVFELKLESFEAASKIKLIKEVRSFTDLGLKEAKDLVEKAPSVLKTGLSKEEGEQLIEKLKAIGAKVVLE